MISVKREKKEHIASQINQSDRQEPSVKTKKKLCIGFDMSRSNEHAQMRKKSMQINDNIEERVIGKNPLSSKDKISHIHEAIDLFFDKITDEALKRPKPELTEKKEITIFKDEEEETLRNKFEIRNHLLDDLEHQILEQQTQLVEKSEDSKRLQKEIMTQDQSLQSMKKQFDEKKQEKQSLEKEIEERDRIIQDIEGQLLEKQAWIVENNY